MNRDRLTTLGVPLVVIACCLGLPILASVGVGATALLLGSGLPLAVVAVLIAWVVVLSHDRRT